MFKWLFDWFAGRHAVFTRLARHASAIGRALRKKSAPPGVLSPGPSEATIRLGEQVACDHLRAFLLLAQREPEHAAEAIGRYLAFRRLGGCWLAEAMPLVEKLSSTSLPERDLLRLGLEYLATAPENARGRTRIQARIPLILARLPADLPLVQLARRYLTEPEEFADE